MLFLEKKTLSPYLPLQRRDPQKFPKIEVREEKKKKNQQNPLKETTFI